MIKSWATHEWYLPPQTEQLPGFEHVGTHLRDDGVATGCRAGDTVWMAQDEQCAVGLAWEWVEVKPGIVMLADPNSIITNLQFVDDQHVAVYGLAKTVAVNRLVHGLAWQTQVCELLRTQLQTAGRALEPQALPTPPRQTHSAGVAPTWTRADAARGIAQKAALRAVPASLRKTTHEARGQAHSRATDHEDGAACAPRTDLRRAA